MTLLLTDKFKQTCRTCLSTEGEMISIFSSSDFYVDLHLPDKIMAFTEIQISDDDDLPKTICKKCIFLADSLYCFKRQCESSDVYLKSLISRKSNDVTGSDVAGFNHFFQRKKTGELDVREKLLVEAERDYIVEYISEETRNEVENAMRRRQAAERRISMEKVSETIRNLKGIEVVPINEFPVTRGDKISRVERNEEIVVFPINLSNKRCGSIETIVNDDALPQEKRSKQTVEAEFEKIEEKDVKRGDIIIYGKDKKLNFTTVRKMVRIDGQKLEKRRDSGGEISPVVENVVVDLTEVNDKTEKPQIQIDENSPEQRKKGAKIDENYLRTSTVGRIISDIDDHSIGDDNNEAEEEEVLVLTYNDAKEKSAPMFSYRTDKINEIFIEKEINDLSNKYSVTSEDKNINNVGLSTKNCPEYSSNNFESNSIVNDIKMAKKSVNTSVLSNKETALALSSVNSSEKENRKIWNLEMYRSKGLEQAKNNFLPKDKMILQQYFGESNSKFYRCTICSINFISMPTVLRHNAKEHMAVDGPFFCLICDKEFDKKLSLIDHVDVHSGSKPFKCTFCPKTFTLQRNLKRHVIHHINYKPFQCKVCIKRFSDRSSLKSHTYLHTGDSPFACKICNVSFNNKTNWRRHVITTHEKLSAVSCKYCGKELPDKRSLNVHERVHTGERPYQCRHCDKRFTQQCNLKTHIHCHLNDRPFICPYCGKGFNQRGTRDDHILTHTGEKPYKCAECDASFTVVSALKRHMWIHLDKDRPYNCDKCELSFVGLYDLRRHVKSRHGESVTLDIVATSDGNKEEERSFGNFRESEANSNGDGKFEPVQSRVMVEYGRAEIPVKKNVSPSCRLTNFTDLQTETKDQSSSDAKTGNLMNETKKEEELENYYCIVPDDEAKEMLIS